MSRAPEEIEDELLVLQCQEGSGEALRALIARWQPRFRRLAWHLTAEREAVQDIVQEAWLAILRGIKRLDDPARFRSWAYRIVSNKCADWARRRAANRHAVNHLHEAAPSAVCGWSRGADSADDVTRMRDALIRLPGDQRAILSLHYLDGMGIAEIARVLNVPNGTVKSRLYHARSRLKQVIERTKT